MKVLITGGSGFVGRYLCRSFREKGWDVSIIDEKPFDESGFTTGEIREYVETKITDYEKVFKALKGIDLVIHLAAKHRFFGITEEDFYRVNVAGTENILKAMEEYKIKKMLFYS